MRNQGYQSTLIDRIILDCQDLGKNEIYAAAEVKGSGHWWSNRKFEKVGECRSCHSWPNHCKEIGLYRLNLQKN